VFGFGAEVRDGIGDPADTTRIGVPVYLNDYPTG